MIVDTPDMHGKVIKQVMTRRKIHGDQESDDSNHDEILQNVFGVRREKVETETTDENANFLVEHRKKEAKWRKQNLG